MAATRRILIASASTGTGHLRAGDALKRSIQAAEPRWKVDHLDVLTLAPRWFKAAYGGGFEVLAAHAPRLWGGLYRWADGPHADPARWAAAVERVLFRPFRRLLHAGAWDLCLCTHFLPSQLAAARTGFPPFALVITDLTLHRYWTQPRVNRYFVASAELAAGIHQRLPNASIDVTGIPIADGFARPLDARAARRELGLDPDRPVALLMGGGLGLRIEESVSAVMDSGLDQLQLVVICGRNAGARQRLERCGFDQRVHIRGYVDEIERFYSAADVVITKPGGLTTSEVLAMGRPLLLTRPLPGHEEGNLDALLESGAALKAITCQELRFALQQVFDGTGVHRSMSRAARGLARPHAASLITRAIQLDLERVAAA